MTPSVWFIVLLFLSKSIAEAYNGHGGIGVLSKLPINDPHLYIQLEFRNHHIFELRPNVIVNLPILTHLDMSHNKLESLPSNGFVNLPNLSELLIYENQIKNIQDRCFVNLAELKHIDLDGNKLKTFHHSWFENSYNIEVILLNDNEIRFLELKSFTAFNKLHTLGLRNNKLEAFDSNLIKHNIVNFKEVDLDGNNIKKFDLEDSLAKYVEVFKNLKCHIVDIIPVLKKTPHVNVKFHESIVFARNEMMELQSNVLVDLPRVRILAILESNLTHLSSNSFVNLPKVSVVKVIDSKIKTISNGCFVNLTMETLGLEGNKLKTFSHKWFVNSFMVNWIDLERNEITHLELEAFQRFPYLSTLKLSYNRIERFDANIIKYSKVDFLMVLLYGNKIKQFDAEQSVLKNMAIFEGVHCVNDDYIPTLAEMPIVNVDVCEKITFGHNNMLELKPNVFLNLSKLKSLTISENKLTHLPPNAFDNIINLEHVDVVDTEIQNISEGSFSNLPNLDVIGLQRNKLKTFSHKWFVNAFGMTWIDLERNEISYFDLEAFKPFYRLHTLKLSYNRLEKFDANIIKYTRNDFRDVLLSGNNIKEFLGDQSILQMSHVFKGVSYLSDDSIRVLSKLPINNADMYDNIIFSRNGMEALRPTLFANLPTISALAIKENNLTFLSCKTFINLPNFLTIEINNNQIDYISEECFVDLPRLQKVLLQGNKLNSFNPSWFINSYDVYLINLEDNKIEFVGPETFRPFSKLSVLKLSRNRLERVSPDVLTGKPELSQVLLGGNRMNPSDMKYLSEIFGEIFFDLEYFNNDYIHHLQQFPVNNIQVYGNITFSSNGMYVLKPNIFANFTKVKVISIQKNYLFVLPPKAFVNLPELLSLDLVDNKIESIFEECFVDLITLQTIDLQRNKLRKFNKKWFVNSFNVRSINIEDNQIEYLEEAAFKPFEKLTTLKLSRNKLEKIDPNVFNGNFNLNQLLFGGNRLKWFDLGGSIKNFIGARIDLRENLLMYLHLPDVQSDNSPAEICLRKNPFKCECMSDLVSWTNRTGVKITGLATESSEPVCVISNQNHSNCTTDYDQEAVEYFSKTLRQFLFLFTMLSRYDRGLIEDCCLFQV